MRRRLEKLGNAWEIALAGIASVAFGVSYGYTFGVDNQVQYMIGALRLLDPTILNRDWYATQTTHYHFAFKYVAAALIAINREGWGVAGFHTIVVATGMMCLYALFRVLGKRACALPGFLMLMAIAMITRTHAANVTYVFDVMLQPSTLGGVAFLASVPYFARGRWLESGVLMALSGLFHGNMLLLLILVYGTAHVLLGTRGLALRLALQFVAPSLVFLLFIPIILKNATAPRAALAQEIFFYIRCPHHFVPSLVEGAYIPFVAWQMIGAGASLKLLRTDENGRRLGALIGGLLVIIWCSLVMATAIHVRQVMQLFAWRLTPHCELLLQVLACRGAVELFLDPGSIRRHGVAAAGLVVAGAGFLVMHQVDVERPSQAVLVVAILGVVVIAQLAAVAVRNIAAVRALPPLRRLWERSGPGIAVIAATVCLMPTTIHVLTKVRERSTLFTGFAPAETELYEWMRRSTAKDALFLTPPDIDKVRFQSQRAIVVDWKSCPFLPEELLEWFERIKDVTGRPKFASIQDLDGYSSLDQARLTALRRKYSLDYVVVRRGKEATLGEHRLAYANDGFAVLELHGER